MKEPPQGCQEIPGVIVEVGPSRKLWLTATGEVTDRWAERGVWPDQATADRFVASVLPVVNPA